MGNIQEETTRTAGLSDKIKGLMEEKINEEAKNKSKFSLFKKRNPLEKKIKLSNSQLEKGAVIYIWIHPNGQLKITKEYPNQQVAYNKREETYHMSSAEYIMHYKKYPISIQYIDSVEPLRTKEITPEQLEEDAKKFGKGLTAERFFIRLMEEVNLNLQKKKGGNKIIIWIIVGLVGLYLVTQAFGVKLF